MKHFIEALNHPAEAFAKRYKTISWGLVIITILINAIVEPVLQHFYGIKHPDFDVLRMLKLTAYGLLSYIIICILFWAVCRFLGSNKTIYDHIKAWGISYTPTVICAVVVALTEVFFYVFWNNTIWGMLLNIAFVGILIWKTILYFVYLKDFANLKGWRFAVAFIVMGIIILIMATVNGYFGLKTPVL